MEFQNKTFDVDDEGFLQDCDDWCPKWIEYARTTQETADVRR